MIFMLSSDHQTPVRPNSDTPSSPGGAGVPAANPIGDVDEQVHFEHVLPGEDKTETPRHEPISLRSPPAMTASQKAKHDLTHLPPHLGCSICRSTRPPDLAHTATHEEQRTIPLLVGDYCFLKTFTEKILATCLVLRL